MRMSFGGLDFFLGGIFSSRPASQRVSMHSMKVLYWTFASLSILVVFVFLVVTFIMSAKICSLSLRSMFSAYSFFIIFSSSPFLNRILRCVHLMLSALICIVGVILEFNFLGQFFYNIC